MVATGHCYTAKCKMILRLGVSDLSLDKIGKLIDYAHLSLTKFKVLIYIKVKAVLKFGKGVHSL